MEMEKKNLPESTENIEYLPPRLVKSVQGWYVIFYQINPATGKLERERKSYNLNRIKSEGERNKRAQAILKELGKLLPMGYPWVAGGQVFELSKYRIMREKEAEANRPVAERSVMEALVQVTKMKTVGMMPETAKTYNSRSKLFAEWLTKSKLADLPLSRFNRQHAQAYLDDARQRVGNNTYNNYRRECIVFFNVMKNREWIAVNPFEKTERLAKKKKRRRKFEADEAAAMLDYLYEHDYWLLVLVLLHLGGCLRRTESYQLRFRDFKLREGYIQIDEERSKNHRDAPITIPEQVRLVLLDKRFADQPSGWLVFGYLCRPHPDTPAGDNSFKHRHRQVLLRLKKEGKIADITGLSLYSWKDTGMSALAKFLTPFELKDQARHADTATSMLYYEGDKVIANVRTAELPMLTGIAERQRAALVEEGRG